MASSSSVVGSLVWSRGLFVAPARETAQNRLLAVMKESVGDRSVASALAEALCLFFPVDSTFSRTEPALCLMHGECIQCLLNSLLFISDVHSKLTVFNRENGVAS